MHSNSPRCKKDSRAGGSESPVSRMGLGILLCSNVCGTFFAFSSSVSEPSIECFLKALSLGLGIYNLLTITMTWLRRMLACLCLLSLVKKAQFREMEKFTHDHAIEGDTARI